MGLDCATAQGSESRGLWHVGMACISVLRTVRTKAQGQREVAANFGPHPHRLFLLAVVFIAKFGFILHWRTCYTLCNLKFLIA